MRFNRRRLWRLDAPLNVAQQAQYSRWRRRGIQRLLGRNRSTVSRCLTQSGRTGPSNKSVVSSGPSVAGRIDPCDETNNRPAGRVESSACLYKTSKALPLPGRQSRPANGNVIRRSARPPSDREWNTADGTTESSLKCHAEETRRRWIAITSFLFLVRRSCLTSGRMTRRADPRPLMSPSPIGRPTRLFFSKRPGRLLLSTRNALHN